MALRKLQFCKHTQVIVWLGFAWPATACLDSYTPPDSLSALPPPAAFIDARGQRWEPRRKVTQFAADEPQALQDLSRDSKRWQDLPDPLAIERLRPITLTPDNYEVALSDDDTLQLVQQLRQAASSVPPSAPMLVADPDRAPTARTARVLSEERFPTQTFGDDERVNVNSSAGEAPWVFIAAMANAGQCTAFKLLNEHTAVTAAHCVHSGTEWRRRKTLQFAAGAQQPKTALLADCYSLTVAGGWDGEDPEYDYAVIRLREDGLEGGASCELADYTVGHFGYQLVNECSVDIPLNLAGYPSKLDPDNPAPTGEWNYPSLFNHYRADGWSACAGLYPSALWFYNDSTNGQSGAPVWTFHQDTGQNQVRAIHRGSTTTVVGDANRGRRLDDALVAWLELNAGY